MILGLHWFSLSPGPARRIHCAMVAALSVYRPTRHRPGRVRPIAAELRLDSTTRPCTNAPLVLYLCFQQWRSAIGCARMSLYGSELQDFVIDGFGLENINWGQEPRMTQVQIEVETEEDGRFLAEAPALPGVMAYGNTRQEAVRKVQALLLRSLRTGLSTANRHLNYLASGSRQEQSGLQLHVRSDRARLLRFGAKSTGHQGARIVLGTGGPIVSLHSMMGRQIAPIACARQSIGFVYLKRTIAIHSQPLRRWYTENAIHPQHECLGTLPQGSQNADHR